jgi:uncharacterized membrane protein YkvA (DUF1232 family)
MWQRLRQWARRLKAETLCLWFCCKHPDTPWSAKIAASLVVGYALSPIDLIPDFIPVLGLLDDVILLPIGIYLTLKLVPRHVIDQCRAQADDWMAAQQPKPRSYAAGAAIIAIWVLALWIIWRIFLSAG